VCVNTVREDEKRHSNATNVNTKKQSAAFGTLRTSRTHHSCPVQQGTPYARI
jgi:hypothetical protein